MERQVPKSNPPTPVRNFFGCASWFLHCWFLLPLFSSVVSSSVFMLVPLLCLRWTCDYVGLLFYQFYELPLCSQSYCAVFQSLVWMNLHLTHKNKNTSKKETLSRLIRNRAITFIYTYKYRKIPSKVTQDDATTTELWRTAV